MMYLYSNRKFIKRLVPLKISFKLNSEIDHSKGAMDNDSKA